MSTFHSESGKGDKQRPSEVTEDQFSNNWERIFGAKKKAGEVCKVCHGEGGCFDAGWWYECSACRKE